VKKEVLLELVLPISRFLLGTEFPWMLVAEIISRNNSTQELVGYGIDQRSKMVFPNT
jgi:hypothetical protein